MHKKYKIQAKIRVSSYNNYLLQFVYKRVELSGHTNGSSALKEVFLLAAGVSILFHRALAMCWWPTKEGWK